MNDLDIGIDRITISFAIRDYDRHRGSSDAISVLPKRQRRVGVDVGGTRATLCVYHTRSSPQATLEVNPARVHDPEGFHPCPFHVVPGIMANLFEAGNSSSRSLRKNGGGARGEVSDTPGEFNRTTVTEGEEHQHG